MTSVSLLVDHPKWHEGYLTSYKSALVSNNRLALATQRLGIDQFILTKQFTGSKWQPPYNHEHLQAKSTGQRDLSTKTLADVAEALIGAAYVDGGQENVCIFLRVLIPQLTWQLMDRSAARLAEDATWERQGLPAEHYFQLERLVEHKFRNIFLAVEAVTHPSHLGGPRDFTPSYQRLEFLGDAILDHIVTDRIYQSSIVSSIPVFRMHLVRTAMVNANFLAFLGMNLTIDIRRNKVLDASDADEVLMVQVSEEQSLYKFLRSNHTLDVALAQRASTLRFQQCREEVLEALANGRAYPWALLVSFAPEKFFSDIIESMLTAIYVDTAGSLDSCVSFLTRLKLLPYLDRVLDEGVKVWHPKEELGVVAVERTVKYLVVETSPRFDCEVLVGGQLMAKVQGQRTRLLAETLAAEAAIDMIKRSTQSAQFAADASFGEGLLVDEVDESLIRSVA